MASPLRNSRRLSLEPLEPRDVPTQIGTLDPSFNTDGEVTLDGIPFSGVALQPDGKIVAVGTTGTANVIVFRYTPDGLPDLTFDGRGFKDIDLGGAESASVVAVQPDGKTVVAGTTDIGATRLFAVARLNPDGSLDTTFDGDGKLTCAPEVVGSDTTVSAVVLQPDGKVILAGTVAGSYAAARLNPDGTLDTTFDGDGQVQVRFSGITLSDTAEAVALQPDGKIVLAGHSSVSSPGSDDFSAARLNPDGSLDTTFDGDGKLVLDFSGSAHDAAADVAVQPDGKIILAGTTLASSPPGDFAVARLNPDGSPDTTFDGDGKRTINFGGTDRAAAVLLQPDGKVLVVGNGGTNLEIARLTPAGALDPTFDFDGMASFYLGTQADFVADAVLTPQGRVVTAGNGAGVVGELARVIARLDDPRNLPVGGGPTGRATVYTPDPATGQYAAAGGVAPFGGLGVDVRVATGDVNGDGAEDTVLVTGPGTPIRVAVVSGKDNTTLLVAPFDPFGGDFAGGGFVTAADLDNDGRAEFVVTPDRAGGPRVVILSLATDGTVSQRASFFGIDDPGFRGGARTAAGDVNADGVADLAVAAGFEGGPRVALFDGKTLFTTPTRLVNDFFAFEDTLRNGAYVTIGDINGDGFGDLIFGAGPGGSPRVLGVSGKALLDQGAVAAIGTPLTNFFVAGNSTDRGGVRVATTDANGDTRAELVVGSGEGQPSRAHVYRWDFPWGGEPTDFQDLDPFGGVPLADGVFVG